MEAAKCIIQDGIGIVGKRPWARCLKRQPRRCLKCQSFNIKNLTAKYKHPNMCGTCSKEHRTAKCEEANSDKFCCMNCKVPGHESWDWLCPAFIEVSRLL